MTNDEIYSKAMERARSAKKAGCTFDTVVFLEKEIEQLETQNRALKMRLNGFYGDKNFTQLEAVQENTAAEIIKALSDNGYNTITINCYKDIESEG